MNKLFKTLQYSCKMVCALMYAVLIIAPIYAEGQESINIFDLADEQNLYELSASAEKAEAKLFYIFPMSSGLKNDFPHCDILTIANSASLRIHGSSDSCVIPLTSHADKGFLDMLQATRTLEPYDDEIIYEFWDREHLVISVGNRPLYWIRGDYTDFRVYVGGR